MSRDAAIARAESYYDDGELYADLARRVAIPSSSQDAKYKPDLDHYLEGEMTPWFEDRGFDCAIYPNPKEGGPPFLIASRVEDAGLPTVMTYGHGDVVLGHEGRWSDDRDPWTLDRDGEGDAERWYGRGTADNKAQHTINLAAMDAVLAERGSLGFNVVCMIETGEEVGSPGIRDFARQHADLFQACDLLVASDGPRIKPDQATIFLGSRQVFNFWMTLDLRQGGHHSGNWGGLLANPGVILSHALASIVDAKGRIKLEALKAPPMSNSVRDAIARLTLEGGDDAPEIDPDWGEPGLTTEEKVFASNTFEILAMETGSPANPVNAVPPRARMACHIRYVAGSDPDTFLPAIQDHLEASGFDGVELSVRREEVVPATRLDPDHPWARWAVASMERTTGAEVAVIPNLGGTLPNDAFASILGLPTIWVPHSYAGCKQHAPDEHVLAPVMRDAMRVMAGLWWDLGDGGTP